MSDTVIEYEMGYQPDEFGRVLCGPFSGENSAYYCESIAPDHWRISQHDESFRVDIKTAELPKRKLGPLMELPVLQVRFDLKDSKEQLKRDFFKRFHQYFHKGGG